ncbi:MAG: hypothetical protein CBC09_06875 [Cellvibrionales bacterium TMED49]|nr:MAG: hypothetical protein CBC09_06875 [Cellvibrionales bacterium TMED49]
MTLLSYFVRSIFLIFWLIFFLNFFIPLTGYWSLTITCGGLLLSTLHLSEFFVVQRSPESIRPAGIADIILILLFGSNHWLPLLEKRDDNKSSVGSLTEDPPIDS